MKISYMNYEKLIYNGLMEYMREKKTVQVAPM